MKILLHGGFCCGVKHISGLCLPEYTAEARAPLPVGQASIDRSPMAAVNDMHRELYGEDFFNEEAPAEKYPERLKRMVEFVKSRRTHHCIEVVIQKINQKKWIPHLEELGFRMVSEFSNSNTHATLQVWHLTY